MSKYDWADAQKEARFIFTDQDGCVFESNFEPALNDDGWRGTGLSSWWFSECNPFKGNWRESLEERPK